MYELVKFEIETMKTICKENSNLLDISDVKTTEACIYIFLPFSEGGDLQDLFRRVC